MIGVSGFTFEDHFPINKAFQQPPWVKIIHLESASERGRTKKSNIKMGQIFISETFS